MQRKCTVGERAIEIAADLTIPYETVKTYTKLVRRSWRDGKERKDSKRAMFEIGT